MSYLFDYVYHGESLKRSDRATEKQKKVSSATSHLSKVDASVSSPHSTSGVTSAVSKPKGLRRASIAVSVASFIQKNSTSRAASGVSEPHPLRRASFAVSGSSLTHKKRTSASVSEIEDVESASRKPAQLRSSKSESHIARKPDLTRRDNWKVAFFVANAKRKFSDEGDKLLTRRPSLTDCVKVAMLKRPDGEKRKILREMKRKAFVQKVTVYLHPSFD